MLALGSAVGPPELIAALHGPGLAALLEKVIDTPIRGVVYRLVEPSMVRFWQVEPVWSRARVNARGSPTSVTATPEERLQVTATRLPGCLDGGCEPLQTG